eukprot:Blabericola_migrator_1__12500@NODE_790_length_6495_cov_70_128034_g559_i0_p3_GENE_NODE_790_length_6495_cov_70_128034_g559_i0NODE_790_length_6495_cov_70_128034_g559_i0_p3_ORF_typecomplete_len352_score28_63PAP2/PF01569_21/2_1e03PAP2/PF01569_21/1_3e26PAP2_3/PF14378_6/2_1e06DUF2456/PF10445_9/1_5e03DUF2456/PF10445_9/7_2e02DUF2456/PF10445_9/0_18Shisa/PF13908_6/4e02Shisa/PF13908_6/0_67Mid2/PF04478_12/1_8e04Mid2/PF04478_12/10Mid2/PF04478_12/50Tetraspanin/PF00335_20/0_8Tetraspanin/PF00335_20/1_6e02FUSC/PF
MSGSIRSHKQRRPRPPVRNPFRRAFYINEVVCRLVIVAIGLIFQYAMDPFVRDVQGKDWPDYAYPYKSTQMFSESRATIILVVVTLGMYIISVSVLCFGGRWTLELVLEEFILFFLGVSLSAALDYMACTIIKKMYGRLRPDYLSRCFGNNDPSVWMTANGFADYNSIPEIPVCNDKAGSFGLSESDMKDARMSFPSAHSSLSFAIIGFVALWQYSKLCLFQDWGAWRLTIPAGLLTLCVAIATSRTSDYRHHPSDVIGGIIIGLVIAVISFCFYFPINMKPIATCIYEQHAEENKEIRLWARDVARLKVRQKCADTAPSETRQIEIKTSHTAHDSPRTQVSVDVNQPRTP